VIERRRAGNNSETFSPLPPLFYFSFSPLIGLDVPALQILVC